MQRLIVGLGNPGEQYAKTRHNAGVWLIERLCEHFQVTLHWKKNHQSMIGDFHFQGQKRLLCVPQVYINQSGRAVRSIQRFYNIPVDSTLVAHDELDIPVGEIKLKNGGGHGGHNGLRDIHAHLGSHLYNRCRIGIGHPGQAHQVSNYVLGKPSKNEAMSIHAEMDRVVEHIDPILQGDWQEAKLQLHTKNN